MLLGMSLHRAVVRGLVVMALVALFGGLWAVFASSARADNHDFVAARACNHFIVNLSNYDNPSENPAPNRISITIDDVAVVDAVEFADEYFYSMDLDPNVEKEILVEVFDPEDPTGSEGWTFSRSYSIPACEEPATTTTAPATTTTAPATTTTAPATTTSVTVAPSTLPFTVWGSFVSALLAVVLFGSGALILLITRRAED